MKRDNAPATRLPAGAALKKLWDLHGVIGTGQSLSVGVDGTPLRATQPSYRNLKLDLGSDFFPETRDPASRRLSLVPLCEPIRRLAGGASVAFPANIFGETPHTCMATQITAQVLAESGGKGDYVTVHTVVGESGQALKTLSKGAEQSDERGQAYAASLFEVRAIARLAKQLGRSFGVAAIVLTHGETDAKNADYQSELRRLLRDYNVDLALITGQKQRAVLLLTQQSSSPPDPGSVAASALAALEACREKPGEILCAGPRYQYDYVDDALHLTALAYDRLGEKYGQVYFERVVREKAWRPLVPVAFERQGDMVSVDFHVPFPPLTWEEGLPRPHRAQAEPHPWVNGRGFELVADGVPVVIDSVEIVGARVNIQARGSQGRSLIVRYAATANPRPRPGGTWRWGQLRDSDPFVGSTTRTPQPNFAMTFERELP
jgi:hypothetical protein